MNTSAVAVTFALSLAACVGEIHTSTQSLLAPQDSGALLSQATPQAAREVTRLLEVRGYALLDQHAVAADGTLLLKYSKSARNLPDYAYPGAVATAGAVGSVIYAWATPRSPGTTLLSMVGKPTVAGAEPCTVEVALPCTPVEAMPYYSAAFLSGQAEAEVVHGVVSELQLEGIAIGPGEPVALAVPQLAAEPPVDCQALRANLQARAASTYDLIAQRKLEDELPSCAP